MSTLASDLQAAIAELDPDSATKLERLVRDAIALAQPSKAKPVAVDAKGWPVGYWEKFAGCLAGEQWDLPDDPPTGANSRVVMRYLLDSNIVIFALKDAQGRSALRIGEPSHDEVVICSAAEAELYRGATKYGRPARREAALIRPFPPDHFLPPGLQC